MLTKNYSKNVYLKEAHKTSKLPRPKCSDLYNGVIENCLSNTSLFPYIKGDEHGYVPRINVDM